MPDILIRGIGIPSKSDLVVHIYPDGKAVFYPFHSKPCKVEVLELPPHGDLIDRDAIKYVTLYGAVLGTTEPIINEQPVVVPEERSGE